MAVNSEFGLFLNSGSVHLSSTPVSRQHRGHIYLDTPRGAVRTGSWHHVAAVLASDVDGGVMRIYIDGAGAAWFANDRSDPSVGFRDLALGVETGPEWKRTVGFSLGTVDDSVRLEFARALDDDPAALEPSSDGWSMKARISRAF